MTVRPQSRAPSSLERLLAEAIRAHQAGRLEEAKQRYLEALAIDVKHAKSLYGLGLIAHQTGNLDGAARLMERAIAVNRASDAYHASLGAVLRQQGNAQGAFAAYETALRLNPENEEAHFHLAEILRERGKLSEAEQHYRRSLALRPDCTETWQNLGMVLRRAGRLEEARVALERALAIDPGNTAALHNLGNLLLTGGNLSAAKGCFERVLLLEPNFAEAYNGLGAVLQEEGDLEAADASYRRALELKPAYAEAHCNLGNLARRQGELEAARKQYERAVALHPGLAEAHGNLGLIAQNQGQLEVARERYNHALALEPASADARWNRCLLDLLEGDMAAGWKHYEVRHLRRQSAPRSFAGRLWRGEPLKGETIFLHSEQGLGDTLQFLRYVPMVKAAGGDVILDVQEPVRRLAAELPGIRLRSGADTEIPPYSWQCPLMGLPHAFRTTLASIPREVPYLGVPRAAEESAGRFSWPTEGLRVGVLWSGNPKHLEDRYRSIPLPQWRPLLDLEGAHFFSLQLEVPDAQLAAAGPSLVPLAGAIRDLADTAALMMHLDLVITVDTAVAHLAGALARPVWVLLPFAPDWRWLLERRDTPWYPSMRLFRQPRILAWEPVLEEVKRELGALVLEKAR